MAGHGSPPAEDRANHPARQVGRATVNTIGPASRFNPDVSPAINAAAARADAFYRSNEHRYSSFRDWPN